MLPAPAPTRLLSLHDVHGAPLADYDWYPALSLLHVYWHGHLTAASLVRGAQVGLELAPFQGENLPLRVLTAHDQASGNWEEALPWLQYDWLPQVQARGLRRLAHVVSPDPDSRLTAPDGRELQQALRQVLRLQLFRHVPPAWHWLTHR